MPVGGAISWAMKPSAGLITLRIVGRPCAASQAQDWAIPPLAQSAFEGQGGTLSLEGSPRSSPFSPTPAAANLAPTDPRSAEQPGVGKEQPLTTPKIRVLMVDDQALMRQACGRVLETEPGIDVGGFAPHGNDAVVLATTAHPDVVIMDGRMPRLNHVGAARMMRERHPDTGIILLLQEQGLSAEAAPHQVDRPGTGRPGRARREDRAGAVDRFQAGGPLARRRVRLPR